MFRTHTCGALRNTHIGEKVQLSGWVSIVRDKGQVLWIDLRDRYGITQIVLDSENSSPELFAQARLLKREFVTKIEGEVIERESKNPNIPTGDVEVRAHRIEVLSTAKLPPFLIDDQTDGGEELRMQYRYLDIRRNPVKNKLIFRSQVAQKVRNFLTDEGFVEVETPVLIKSTPEGARDFVVPSRMNPNEFYALPQSPQTFKQLLMVGGLDKYFQIVKCFRDEDLRADRQPEFTQIDCEMSFVTQEEILNTFEALTRYLLKAVKDVEVNAFPRMTYAEAMRRFGNDKPDIRFGMEFGELTELAQGKGFGVFDSVEKIIGIAIPGGASYTRKEIDKWVDWVKRPQIGANGMVYAKYNADGTFKSSVDKFYTQEDLAQWAEKTAAKPGDLIAVLAGKSTEVPAQLSALRMEVAERLGLRKADEFAPLWVVDFPLLEWDEETQRYHAMHHPFTSPKPEDMDKLETNPGEVRANAYDLVLNGNEIGGGSVRIYDASVQNRMFELLGFSPEEAQAQFGFLLDAFTYGAPPHAGIAFGFDRLVAILDGSETIRDYIAFPKNNNGRDVMIDAPAEIAQEQLQELFLKTVPKERE